jgi:hypothetical protein
MVTEEQFHFIVEEVIRRLARRMDELRRNEIIIVVFTGATVGLVEGVQQVRSLLLDGFQVKLAFSDSAGHLFAEMVQKELNDFTNLGLLSPEKWLSSLKQACAVAVPMLSLNTVSKLSLLIADDLVSNILLHALLLGKPLVMAKEGADPDGKGRRALGFHKGNAALNDAMMQRLKSLEDFGCILTGIGQLSNSVRSVIQQEGLRQSREQNLISERPSICPGGRVATAGDVLSAHRRGSNLNLGPAGRVTPLALDLARKLGIGLITAQER